MPTLALQQVSGPFAKENASRTLEKPVALKILAPHIDAEVLAKLMAACDDRAVYVWGSKLERRHQTYKVVGRDALVLFRRGGKIYKFGVVIEKIENRTLAEKLWGKDADGETWSTIYFFARIVDKVLPAADVNKMLKRSAKDNWQGLVVLTMKDSEVVDAFFQTQLAGL